MCAWVFTAAWPASATDQELNTLREEFKDRFGQPPEGVLNLFFQLKMKLLAESAGLASITVESGQLALRFPDGVLPDNLPYLGENVRVGKFALWLPYTGAMNEGMNDWSDPLIETLHKLGRKPQTAQPPEMGLGQPAWGG